VLIGVVLLIIGIAAHMLFLGVAGALVAVISGAQLLFGRRRGGAGWGGGFRR
jgi:hypothetical protein